MNYTDLDSIIKDMYLLFFKYRRTLDVLSNWGGNLSTVLIILRSMQAFKVK